MSWELIFVVAVIVIGLVCAGGAVVFAVKVIWHGATLVAETKIGNARLGELKTSIDTVLENHGERLDEHDQTLRQHGQAIGVLAALNGKDPKELTDKTGA